MADVGVVNVDLDSHSGYDLVRVYLNAAKFGDTTCYYTRHGFHVEVALSEPVSYQGALDIRYLLGDCVGRLGYDEGRVARGDCRFFDRLFHGRMKDGVYFVRKEIRVL